MHEVLNAIALDAVFRGKFFEGRLSGYNDGDRFRFVLGRMDAYVGDDSGRAVDRLQLRCVSAFKSLCERGPG